MNAAISIRARLENASDVAQKGTRFQMAKGKGRSTPTQTSSQPSSSAKPKAQPKKKSGKGGGKGKKDKPSVKSSVKSSAKSSAKAGKVSFDNDDAEEEEHHAENDWEEDEECVAEEEQEDTFAERAFATAYHSHVCEVCDPDDHEFESPLRVCDSWGVTGQCSLGGALDHG